MDDVAASDVSVAVLTSFPEENFTAQSLLELNESSHFSLIVVLFGLKRFSFISPKIP